MNHVNRRKIKAVALLLAGLASANSAWALNTGDILTINRENPIDGVTRCVTTGASHPHLAGSGSCFGMEVAAPDIIYKRLRGFNHIVIGSAQAASGSHQGVPSALNPPFLTESPGIDMPWDFFTNTGMHFTSVPITEIAPNSVLDFSGWTVTWNGIPAIYMGTGAHGAGFVNGQAQIVCNPVNCSNGATYTLAYTATVPGNSPNFAGVLYSLRLEGTVVVPSGAQSLPLGIAAGSTGGATTIRVTEAHLTAASIPVDSSFSNSGGYYDFITPVTALGGTTQVALSLTAALPAGFVYRKYKNGSWMSFVTGGSDSIMSAPGTGPGGTCPAPGNVAYASPATAGHYCLQLTITDGGPNDADGNPDSSVRDPGGVATAVGIFQDNRTSGSSGCSLSATPVSPLERSDWWLLLGFVAWMGFVIRRKRAE